MNEARKDEINEEDVRNLHDICSIVQGLVELVIDMYNDNF